MPLPADLAIGQNGLEPTDAGSGYWRANEFQSRELFQTSETIEPVVGDAGAGQVQRFQLRQPLERRKAGIGQQRTGKACGIE